MFIESGPKYSYGQMFLYRMLYLDKYTHFAFINSLPTRELAMKITQNLRIDLVKNLKKIKGFFPFLKWRQFCV